MTCRGHLTGGATCVQPQEIPETLPELEEEKPEAEVRHCRRSWGMYILMGN